MNDLKKIAYNCRKATLLVEKKQLERLTLREQFELKLHLTGCSVCRLFQQQSILINKQVRALLHSSSLRERELDSVFKQSMQEEIEQRLKKGL